MLRLNAIGKLVDSPRLDILSVIANSPILDFLGENKIADHTLHWVIVYLKRSNIVGQGCNIPPLKDNFYQNVVYVMAFILLVLEFQLCPKAGKFISLVDNTW